MSLDQVGHILTFPCGGWGGYGGTPSKATIPLNTWTHIAISFGQQYKLYINGELDHTSDLNYCGLRVAQGAINLNYWGTTDFGLIDELHISKVERSAAEIKGRFCGLGMSLRSISLSGGGNTGQVTVQIHGCGFDPAAQVRLTGLGADIMARTTPINSTLMQAVFDLTGATPGVRNVVVTNPNGTFVTLPAAFTIVAGGSANVQISKTGMTPVPGRDLDYFITVENRGSIDARNVEVSEILDWTQFDLISVNPAGATNLADMVKAAIAVWILPIIAPQQTIVLNYKARLKPTVPIGVQVRGPSCTNALLGIVQCDLAIAKQLLSCATLQGASTFAVCVPSCAALLTIPPPAGPIAAGVCEAGCVGFLIADILQQTTNSACLNAAAAARSSCVSAAINSFNCATFDLFSVGPVDPNEKLTSHPMFIRPDQTLTFPIHYENLGNAEAKDIFITDVLDPNLDTSTMQLLTPGATLDPNTRTIKWNLLNVNLPPKGTGNVLFSIKPRPNLPSGTAIRNTATIQFEIFPPLTTNQTLNIIDMTAPVCKVNALPAQSTNTTIPLSWTGTDAVGIADKYSVFVSVNNGAFTPLVQNTTTTGQAYTGQVGSTYRFYCTAVDTVGNAEIQTPTAEATTTIVTGGPTPIIGDLNNDGLVNCADIAIIRAAFGKRTGQPGFDARADVVKDGVIDVRDLAFVSQRLPVGTRCP